MTSVSPALKKRFLPRDSANQITQSVIDYIRMKGGKATRINTGQRLGVRFGEVGAADVIGCYRGRYVAVEVKAGKDVLSEKQLEWLNDARRAGGVTVIAYSLQDVIDALAGIR